MKLVVSTAMAAGVLIALSVPAFAGDKGCDKNCPKSHAHVRSNPIAATPRADAPSIGAPDAKVTVEVWSDFQCPFCARGADIVDGLRAKYGEQVRIVFRHQPLPMHDNARLASDYAPMDEAQKRALEEDARDLYDVFTHRQHIAQQLLSARYNKKVVNVVEAGKHHCDPGNAMQPAAELKHHRTNAADTLYPPRIGKTQSKTGDY